MDWTLSECLGAAGQSGAVLVQCPANYQLNVISGAVYKSPASADCPSTPTDACWHSNITADVVSARQ